MATLHYNSATARASALTHIHSQNTQSTRQPMHTLQTAQNSLYTGRATFKHAMLLNTRSQHWYSHTSSQGTSRRHSRHRSRSDVWLYVWMSPKSQRQNTMRTLKHTCACHHTQLAADRQVIITALLLQPRRTHLHSPTQGQQPTAAEQTMRHVCSCACCSHMPVC